MVEFTLKHILGALGKGDTINLTHKQKYLTALDDYLKNQQPIQISQLEDIYSILSKITDSSIFPKYILPNLYRASSREITSKKQSPVALDNIYKSIQTIFKNGNTKISGELQELLNPIVGKIHGVIKAQVQKDEDLTNEVFSKMSKGEPLSVESLESLLNIKINVKKKFVFEESLTEEPKVINSVVSDKKYPSTANIKPETTKSISTATYKKQENNLDQKMEASIKVLKGVDFGVDAMNCVYTKDLQYCKKAALDATYLYYSLTGSEYGLAVANVMSLIGNSSSLVSNLIKIVPYTFVSKFAYNFLKSNIAPKNHALLDSTVTFLKLAHQSMHTFDKIVSSPVFEVKNKVENNGLEIREVMQHNKYLESEIWKIRLFKNIVIKNHDLVQNILAKKDLNFHHIETAKMMQDSGLKIEEKDMSLVGSPLGMACFMGDKEMVRLLLKNGADIEFLGGSGNLIRMLELGRENKISNISTIETIEVMSILANAGHSNKDSDSNIPTIIMVDEFGQITNTMDFAGNFGIVSDVNNTTSV